MQYYVNFAWYNYEDTTLNVPDITKEKFLALADRYGEFTSHGIGFANLYTNINADVEDNEYMFDADSLSNFAMEFSKNIHDDKIRITSISRSESSDDDDDTLLTEENASKEELELLKELNGLLGKK